MEIPSSSLIYNIDSYYFNNDKKALLIIIHLFEHNLINYKSFNAYIKKYKDGTISKSKNTYHCKVNDKWYNFESMSNIYLELYSYRNLPKNNIPIEKFIEYIMLVLNKKRNYCIDYIFFEFYKPIIDSINSRNKYNLEIKVSILNSFRLKNELIISEPSYSGWCCDDCSGDFDIYVENQYENRFIECFKQYIKYSINDFTNLKKDIFHGNSCKIQDYCANFR